VLKYRCFDNLFLSYLIKKKHLTCEKDYGIIYAGSIVRQIFHINDLLICQHWIRFGFMLNLVIVILSYYLLILINYDKYINFYSKGGVI